MVPICGALTLLITLIGCHAEPIAIPGSNPVSTISPLPGYTFQWAIDLQQQEIIVSVEAVTDGWIGFGIGERNIGAMPGADMITCDQFGHVADGYGTGLKYNTPVLHTDVLQDWQILGFGYNDVNTTCMVRRKLVTNDKDDRSLEYSPYPTMMLFAFGAGNRPGAYAYHGLNRAHQWVNLFHPNLPDPIKEIVETDEYDGHADLLNDNHTIPHGTEYFDKCFTASEYDFWSENRSIIAVQAVLSSETARFVHHFTVQAYNDERCDGGDSMGTLIYVYGPGGDPLVPPADVGMTIGPSGIKSIRLQTHFTNTENRDNMVDDSGIRIYYTGENQLRTHELAVLQLGDPNVALEGTTLPLGWSNISFDCVSNVTASFHEPITVLYHAQHMHGNGQMMSTSVIHNGNQTQFIKTDFFSFEFQGIVQTNYTVYPGDKFRTKCWYHTANDNAQFGLTTLDEMCIDFVLYYPRQPTLDMFGGVCGYTSGGEMSQSIQTSEPASRHGFGGTHIQNQRCPMNYTASNNFTMCWECTKSDPPTMNEFCASDPDPDPDPPTSLSSSAIKPGPIIGSIVGISVFGAICYILWKKYSTQDEAVEYSRVEQEDVEMQDIYDDDLDDVEFNH